MTAGGRITDFHGWELPIQYASIVAEHQAVRTAVGVFDVSHMGQLLFSGRAAQEHLDALVGRDVMAIKVGHCRYTAFLDVQGQMVDDIIVSRLDAERVIAVPNAGGLEAVRALVMEGAPEGIHDLSDLTSCIAIQGPDSKRVITEVIGMEPKLRFWRLREIPDLAGEGDHELALVSRTGYTGEWGYELLLPNEMAGEVWDRIIAAGAVPCGLGARDTLRLEMGYLLSGQDFAADRTPVEAAQDTMLTWEKAFRGKTRMSEQQVDPDLKVLRGIRCHDRGIPRPGDAVIRGDEEVALLTSGTQSPSLGTGIGLAYLPRTLEVGTRVLIRGKRRDLAAVIASLPFLER